MTENASETTTTEEAEFQYPVKVEDAGPGTKKISIEIPAERIASKLEENFKELRATAVLPGFRPGHAPRKLVEKKFANDVRDQVRRQLISESYSQAIEKNSLNIIGEPQFDNPEGIALPDEGALNFSFSVEVQPEFTLPELKGVKVKKPKVQVTDENVEQAMTNLKEQQGSLVPVEDRGVEAKDFLTADVHAKVDGNIVAHQHDAQLVARAGRLMSIQIDDLDQKLAGLKPGEKRSFTVHAAENHPSEAMRNKDVEIEIALKDLKKLEPAVIDQEFLESLGFNNENELREALREQLVERIGYDVQNAQHQQVRKYLLDNVTMELPEKMSDRQADRVVNRRAMDLLSRGVSREQIEANVQSLRTGSKEEAQRELKLFFILQKIANDFAVDVEEPEMNGRIAMLAAYRGLRPEKLKQQMAKDGSLQNLYIQMREQKALDKILETAEIEEVDVTAAQAAEAAEGEKENKEEK
ncbi:MAG TPA: trigger factor [Tepidisphaeraceae bacterium]|nr:trigger factor [Tepidisphaeraceae bacterium]